MVQLWIGNFYGTYVNSMTTFEWWVCNQGWQVLLANYIKEISHRGHTGTFGILHSIILQDNEDA